MINVPITFDEAYQFIKLYDTLRDMDFELTESQQKRDPEFVKLIKGEIPEKESEDWKM
jgi:hypothetical protein